MAKVGKPEMMTIEELKILRTKVRQDYDMQVPGSDKEDAELAGVGDYLIDLIDAEIERQSVTDEEIDEAEDFVKAVANRMVEIDELAMKIFNESNRHWNLIVDALRAYRKPEPCVWCAEKNEIRPIEHIDYYMEDEYGRMRRLMFRYCPNCGRNLIGVKDDRPHQHFQNGNNHSEQED